MHHSGLSPWIIDVWRGELVGLPAGFINLGVEGVVYFLDSRGDVVVLEGCLTDSSLGGNLLLAEYFHALAMRGHLRSPWRPHETSFVRHGSLVVIGLTLASPLLAAGLRKLPTRCSV